MDDLCEQLNNIISALNPQLQKWLSEQETLHILLPPFDLISLRLSLLLGVGAIDVNDYVRFRACYFRSNPNLVAHGSPQKALEVALSKFLNAIEDFIHINCNPGEDVEYDALYNGLKIKVLPACTNLCCDISLIEGDSSNYDAEFKIDESLLNSDNIDVFILVSLRPDREKYWVIPSAKLDSIKLCGVTQPHGGILVKESSLHVAGQDTIRGAQSLLARLCR